jgi:DNA-binding NarL/FixJ family response regulator
MRMNEELRILVAETSPIIRSGLAACLKRLPDFKILPLEIHSSSELMHVLREKCGQEEVLLVVNPTFEGNFDPVKLRAELNSEMKIIALEVARLDRYVSANYDAVISIVDELNVISDKIKSLVAPEEPDEEGSDKEKEVLSKREKEIVALVVKGLTNQEIADKLYLSVHTVITHRRNIARKLEIHSATGLTIYAIVNKLVDLSEIKL